MKKEEIWNHFKLLWKTDSRVNYYYMRLLRLPAWKREQWLEAFESHNYRRFDDLIMWLEDMPGALSL